MGAVKVTVKSRPSTSDAYDLIVDVTVTRRRPGRLSPSVKLVSVGVAQGAGFVSGYILGSGRSPTEDVNLRTVLARAVCAQLYWGDFAHCACSEIPALTTAQMRRFHAALENVLAFKRAFAGVALPRLGGLR